MKTLINGLYHYFVGYTRDNPDIAKTLISDSWPEIAAKEITRRKHKLIENLSDQDLKAIADGEIDLNIVIQKAANSHKETST